MKRICVNCGSSEGNNPSYRHAANSLGNELARRGIGLVYGGARVGLMGALANAVLAAGGEVIGIITRDLDDIVGHEGLTKLEIVDTMHDRKRRFADLSDGYIAMAGGFGTLEEIFEAITWNQLHIQERPTVDYSNDDVPTSARREMGQTIKNTDVRPCREADPSDLPR